MTVQRRINERDTSEEKIILDETTPQVFAGVGSRLSEYIDIELTLYIPDSK